MSKIRTFRLAVPVNYDLEWVEAIRRGAPNTLKDSLIWGVSDQFPTDKKGTAVEKLSVVQFGPSFHHQDALDYAVSEKKAHIHPRLLWAIGEYHPQLAWEQNESWMFLNSGLTCTAGGGVLFPYLRVFGDVFREACVSAVQFVFDENSWFVFGE